MPTIVITIDVPADAETQTFGEPVIAGVTSDVRDSSWSAIDVITSVCKRVEAGLRMSDDQMALESELIAVLSLTTRVKGALTREDSWHTPVRFVSELIAYTADELMGRTGFGKNGLAEVREALKARGLKLRGDV